MSLRDAFITDPELETRGTWFEIQDGNGSTIAKFLCRRFHSGNKEASRAYRDALKDMDSENIEPEVFEETSAKIWAHHIVLDWDCVTEYDFDEDADETPLPYSAEKCHELFTLYPDVLDTLVRESSKRENYLASLRKKREKNS